VLVRDAVKVLPQLGRVGVGHAEGGAEQAGSTEEARVCRVVDEEQQPRCGEYQRQEHEPLLVAQQRSGGGAGGGDSAHEQLHVQARLGRHGHVRVAVDVGEQVVPME
jgi:hypothetical protein